MSDAKENEEGGQDMPSAVEESQQLIDAEIQVQLEASLCNDTSNHVENGKAEQPSEDHEIGKAGKVDPPAEDNSKKPGKAEPPADDNREKLVKAEPPVEDKSVNPGETELSAEDNIVKPGKVELPDEDNNVEPAVVSGGISQEDDGDSKTCDNGDPIPSSHNNGDPIPSSHDNGDPIPSSHNESTSSQAVPADAKAEIKNELEVENKADEKIAAEPADNGNSYSTHISFLNADHFYDGNESGTEEEQSAFMKELENFFRERSMEFKPPKFYGEGLNCLK